MSTQVLHQGLVEDGFYTGTIQQFQSDYSSKENQQQLYNGIVGDGDFDGSFLEFQNAYFPTQAATVTPTPTQTYQTPTPTPPPVGEGELNKIKTNAVNKTYWKNAGWTDKDTGKWVSAKREDYFKEDDKWYWKDSTTGEKYTVDPGEAGYDELIAEEQRVNDKVTSLWKESVTKEKSESEEILKEYDNVKIGKQGYTFKDYYIGEDGKWYHRQWGLVSHDDKKMDDNQLEDLKKYEHLIPHLKKVRRHLQHTYKDKEKIREEERKTLEAAAIKEEDWEGLGWIDEDTGKRVDAKREDYFKKGNQWYWKDPITGEEHTVDPGEAGYDELMAEDARVGESFLVINDFTRDVDYEKIALETLKKYDNDKIGKQGFLFKDYYIGEDGEWYHNVWGLVSADDKSMDDNQLEDLKEYEHLKDELELIGGRGWKNEQRKLKEKLKEQWDEKPYIISDETEKEILGSNAEEILENYSESEFLKGPYGSKSGWSWDFGDESFKRKQNWSSARGWYGKTITVPQIVINGVAYRKDPTYSKFTGFFYMDSGKRASDSDIAKFKEQKALIEEGSKMKKKINKRVAGGISEANHKLLLKNPEAFFHSEENDGDYNAGEKSGVNLSNFVNTEFWNNKTYTNPEKDESGWNPNYEPGETVNIRREDYQMIGKDNFWRDPNGRKRKEYRKDENGNWEWVNPNDPSDIDKNLNDKTIKQLTAEEYLENVSSDPNDPWLSAIKQTGILAWVNPNDPTDIHIYGDGNQVFFDKATVSELEKEEHKTEKNKIFIGYIEEDEVVEEITVTNQHVAMLKRLNPLAEYHPVPDIAKVVKHDKIIVKTIFKDKITGKRYSFDPNNPGKKIWQDWEPGTPTKVKSRWEELYAAGKHEEADEIWDKYHTTTTYQNPNDYAEFNQISINNDYQELVEKLDKQAAEYFENKVPEIIEEIQEEVEREIHNRFEKNRKGEIIDKSTNSVVSEDFVENLFKRSVQDMVSKNQSIQKIKLENNALYSHAVKQFEKKWKPSYNLIGKDVLSKFGNEYTDWLNRFNKNYGESGAPDKVKVSLVNRLWVTMEKNLSKEFNETHPDHSDAQLLKGDYIDQRKHEFFSYFYNEDGFGLAFDIDDRGREKLSGYTQELLLNTIVRNQKAITEKMNIAGELTYDKMRDINEVIDMAEDLMEQNLQTSEDVDNYFEGLGSLEGVEYIPFVSGIVDMMDSYDTYALAKKAERGEELSAQEKDLLMLHNLKNLSDQRIDDISSSWYKGGKMTAEMLPYVVEFIATSGTYSTARVAVQKGIVKLLKKEAIKKIDDVALKALLKKSGGKIDDAVAKYYIKNIGLSNSAKGLSWIAGTIAQTTANPQRYMNETIKNMTPEMQIMMSEEGNELITAITGEGQRWDEAFVRGFGVTWAEFATERLGETMPVLGKYLGKHNPHTKAWLQSTIVARYMTKFKLSKPQLLKRIQGGMGWNGFIGEMFEEIVNQPLSNLISGVGTEGFTAGDIFEGMDREFFETLAISMGTTQLAFGGLSMLGSKRSKSPGYSIEINGTTLTYETKKEFEEKRKFLEDNNYFSNPDYTINIDINNDVEAFKDTEKILGKYKNRNNKANNVEKSWFDLGLASEVELTEAIMSGMGQKYDPSNSYNYLKTIEEAINELSQQRADLYKSGLSGKKLINALKQNQKELKNLEQAKMDIINPHLENIQKHKRISAYRKITTNIKELAEKMKFDTKIVEHNTLQQTKKAILEDVQRQINELRSLGVLTEKQTQTLAELEGDLNGEEVMGVYPSGHKKEGQPSKNPAHGYIQSFKSQLDENPHGMISKDGKNIFINKSSALAKNGGNINVAAHEFLHRALKTMIDQNPHTQMALGKALHKYVMGIDPRGYAGDFNKRLQAYQEGSIQVEMDKLEQDYMKFQQQPKTKSNKAELKKIEDRYFELQNDFTGNMGEEALTLLSDAMLYGNVNMSNQNLSVLGKIIERILGATGLKATFKTGEDVYDFISEFSNSIQKGEVSRKLRKQLSQQAELKGELKEDQIREAKERKVKKASSNQFSKSIGKAEQELGRSANTPEIIAKNEKLQQDILDSYENGETSLDKNGKIIVSQNIQDQLVENNLPRVTALAAQAANAGKNIELEQDKKKKFDEFFPEYYMKLTDLARTYNAEKVPFGAYMNTLLPLKYSGILEDLKKGEIEGAVGLEKAADVAIENENIEKAGNLIKLYERFGRYAEIYNLKVKEAIKDGKFNPAQENISRIGVNTVDAFPSTTQTMFGVIPKPGNLTRGDVSESQMFINKHPETLISMLPQTAYVVESINPKTGKPSKIKSIGIPRKVLNAFYNKGKRIGNDYAWTLKPNISVSDMLNFAGITERGKPNTYKKDTNTSQSIKGLIDITGRMMTNQAVREHFIESQMPLENMGTLQESMSSNLFSKRLNEASYGDRAILLAALPRIGEHYVTHGRNLEKSFNEILPGWWKEGREQVIKEIEEHIALYEEYETGAILAETIPISLENYITEQTMQLDFEDNLRAVMNLPKGQLDFNNKKQLENVRKAIAKIVYEGNISWQEAKRFLPFLYSTGKTGGTSLRMVEGKGLVKYEDFYDDKIKDVEKQIDKKKAEKKSFKDLTERIEKFKEAKEKGLEPTDHPYGIFESVEAFEKEVLDYKKSKWKKGAKHGIPSNTTQSVGVKLDTPKDITAQEQSAKRNQDFLIKFGNEMNRLMNLETGGISKNDVGMILMSLGNVGMNTPIAAAAKVAYAVDGKKNTTDHIYEHLIPRKIVTLYYANFVLEGTAESQKGMMDLFDDFVVAIIPKEQDKIVNAFGYQKSMPASWFVGANPLQRYFNMRTFGTINLKLTDVKTGKPVTGYEGFQKIHEINGENHKKSVTKNKAILNSRTNFSKPVRGMSTFDFDETVGISDNYVVIKREGETQKIPSDQWPFIDRPQMESEGWEFDFSDFNIVTKGRPGPLMQKLRNRIKKYGPENNYILTARAAESEKAIHEYLKSEGIEIPLKNITGLGNSTGVAKAEWMLEKFSEGYNDMYFVDDALPNVEAVKNVLDQLDIKSNVQQAKQNFSKSIKREFAGIMNNASLDMNRILEQTKGVKAEAVFSAAQAKIRGAKKGKYKWFLPPSAQDFKGLLYHFLGKGRVGEAQMAFFDKALIKPFARAISEINSFKQVLNNKYKAALKEFGVNLKNTVGETNFTEDQAVRVYLWNKAGFEIPGLSKRDLKTLVEYVESNQNLQSFAETIGLASEQEAGYLEPSDYWMVENLQSDILKIANERKRSDFLGEWKQNVEIIFSEANLNKIEAIYGSNFREALEDMLHRMEFGTSRETGSSRIVNRFNNWANQSVGAIMFFNMRSALLQTISSVNFINWSDNNPLKAALAFANQKQFWKDFAMIFNSDMLKQRRGGQQRGINEAELADAVAGSTNKARAALNWLLTKGFLPTQIADSFAIASGGATFYRNRLNTYIKQGYSQEEAHEMAFQDFQENSEESQQSARPDMISQQQASPLGRYILAFKNTPMQYARLIQKAASDLKNGRGDAKTNISKIVYYAMVQNFIFNVLQSSLGMLIGDDDEEDTKKYERTINGMFDSLLGGTGIAGMGVVTLKSAVQEFLKQEKKGWNADHTYTILRFFGLSPTVGSKGRKLYSAIQTWKFDEDVIKEMSLLNIDNPIHSVIGDILSATLNIPLDRIVKKTDNIDAALTEDLSALQRLALLMGWNTWDLDIDDSDVLAVEDEIKEKKTKEKKTKEKKKEKEKKEDKEEKLENKNLEIQKKEKKEGKKDIKCAAVSKSGKRCKTTVEPGSSYCTVHIKVEQGTKEVQCKKIKSDKKRCKMKTKAKSGLCYYHD